MKKNHASQFAEISPDLIYSQEYAGHIRIPASGNCRHRAIEMPEATRKVWHDYLKHSNVSSAVISVVLPAPNFQRNAFLIGLDFARNNAQATHQLLTAAENLWAKLGQQLAVRFKISGDEFGRELALKSCEDSVGKAMLSQFEHGVAAQTQQNGTITRAIFLRNAGIEQFNQQDLGALLSTLPLFADSAAGGAQLARQSQRSAMLEAMFDRVSLTMMMLDADSQPLFMNSSAETMLDQHKWMIRSADGSISAANAVQAKSLRKSIRMAATADANGPTEDVYRLDCQTGDWRLAYVVSAMSRSGDVTTRCALLIVLAPGKMDAPTHLLEALGLLPSEQRFLGHFLKSSSLGNAAVDCGLSEETARTYLKRVRAKLGVHRQMELAGLISGLVLPIHANIDTEVGV